MRKKLLTLLLALVASVGIMFAESGTCGENLNWDLTNRVLTISGTGEMTNWSSPSKVPWCSYRYSIKEVTIGNSVTSIGSYAFSGCKGLTSITIPNSVTSIGKSAFQNCTGLTSITIPNSVTSIGYQAFSWCSGLTSITIPNSVTSIGGYAFEYCSGLTSVTIGNSVTSIGYQAFERCTGLTSVTIPNSVTSIGDAAFAWCSGLTSIVVASGNTKYDSRENCNAIIETSSNTLIAGCQNTIIPNSVTSIGDQAFSGCTGLTSVTIGNSVTSIGKSAFQNCTGLTSIVVSSGNIKYDSRENCNAIIETSSNTLIAGCKNTIIPNSVTSIGSYAFSGCTGLTSVTIPNSVTSIGDRAFQNCTGLTSIVVASGNTKYDSRENCNAIIETSSNKLIAGCQNTIIPNSVKGIRMYAFSGCSGLTSITIPNSVTWIGECAFIGCTGLTSVTIGNSVTSIETYAFSGCTGLTSVTNYATTPQTIYGFVFSSVALSSCTLYVPKGSVDRYKAASEWKDFGSILPISAEKTEVTTPTIEPDVTSAEIAWPQVTDAYTYELVIKDASGNTICTLVFNAQGQLTSITFNAPARENAEQQTQSAGFVFTVNGLEPGTQYNYSIIAKNESGATLKTETGTFTTKSLEGIENVNQQSTIKNKKFLRNGQVLILRGNKTYTLQGQEVR